MRRNKVKIEVLILTGRSIYLMTGLAIVGAGTIMSKTGKAIRKVTKFVENGMTKKEKTKSKEESK